MRQTIIALAVLSTFALVERAFAQGVETERVENAVLYCAPDVEGRAAIMFDGYRVAPLAEDVVVSDVTSGTSESAIDDAGKLLGTLGTAPDWDDVKLGDAFGKDSDTLIANVTLEDKRVVSVEIVKRWKRPLVGVSWTGSEQVGKGQTVIASALLRNGASAILLPQIATEEGCDAALSKLEGFVMPGGTNFNPRWYGETPYPHGSVNIDKARDDNDVFATRWIVKHNVPGLWICRGVQCLNVSLGGGLIQDVPTYQGLRVLKGEIPYKKAEPIPDDGVPGTSPKKPCVPAHYRVYAYGIVHVPGRHGIDISDESKFLLPIVGQKNIASAITSHHQAANPERIGKGLTVVAHSPDGIIEALEYQENDFALGTQFHFEYDSESSDPELQRFSCSFFKALVAHMLARRQR